MGDNVAVPVWCPFAATGQPKELTSWVQGRDLGGVDNLFWRDGTDCPTLTIGTFYTRL